MTDDLVDELWMWLSDEGHIRFTAIKPTSFEAARYIRADRTPSNTAIADENARARGVAKLVDRIVELEAALTSRATEAGKLADELDAVQVDIMVRWLRFGKDIAHAQAIRLQNVATALRSIARGGAT